MQWLLLNQHYANMDTKNLGISVLEEVVSSEVQLVQVLVSGRISLETMISHLRSHHNCNQIAVGDR